MILCTQEAPNLEARGQTHGCPETCVLRRLKPAPLKLIRQGGATAVGGRGWGLLPPGRLQPKRRKSHLPSMTLSAKGGTSAGRVGAGRGGGWVWGRGWGPTLLFSCCSSIWVSVSLARRSSLAACRAARTSALSPLLRPPAPFLDMVRVARGAAARLGRSPACGSSTSSHSPEGKRAVSRPHGPGGPTRGCAGIHLLARVCGRIAHRVTDCRGRLPSAHTPLHGSTFLLPLR